MGAQHPARYPTFVPDTDLTHSPENSEFWDCADPLIIGAGKTGSALRTSIDRYPWVADRKEKLSE
jgi:hypothetical protein